jgi:hypothetical protein
MPILQIWPPGTERWPQSHTSAGLEQALLGLQSLASSCHPLRPNKGAMQSAILGAALCQ